VGLLPPAQGQVFGCVHLLLSPRKWDHWRDDWVNIHTDVHDRLELPTGEPTGKHSYWEKILNLQSAYDLVFKRIQFLARQAPCPLVVYQGE
jgi:hypothetical protein